MKKVLAGLMVVMALNSCNSQNHTTVNGEKVMLEEGLFALFQTTEGDILVQLEMEKAPMTVGNFVALAEGKMPNGVKEDGTPFYDGTIFHRVIPDFMIQGGDPNSKDLDRMNDGTGGGAGKFFGIGREEDSNSWTIPAEFNDKDHVKGTLSMARSSNPNSGSSQFFICHAATPQLNNQYTVFGQVIEGLDVIDQIVYSETPKKQNPGYRGPDGDNPFEKVEMKIKLSTRSEAIKK